MHSLQENIWRNCTVQWHHLLRNLLQPSSQSSYNEVLPCMVPGSMFHRLWYGTGINALSRAVSWHDIASMKAHGAGLYLSLRADAMTTTSDIETDTILREMVFAISIENILKTSFSKAIFHVSIDNTIVFSSAVLNTTLLSSYVWQERFDHGLNSFLPKV